MALGSFKLNTLKDIFSPIAATGGSVVTDIEHSGRLYRYHIFNGSSNFVVSNTGSDANIEYWIVAGGGSGGGNQDAGGPGAGGGAGGLLTNYNGTLLSVTSQSYTITVGAGGARNGLGTPGLNGNNSSAFNITASGGGGGGRGGGGSLNNGLNGASGGGASVTSGTAGTAGTGIPGPPIQGYNGGIGNTSASVVNERAAGGGGGAGAAGNNASKTGSQGIGGNGGDGRYFSVLESIVGTTSVTYINNVPGWIAGGGGGGINTSDGDLTYTGLGGKGGGAQGTAGLNPNQGINAQINSGGGGGGAGRTGLRREGGGGGSGIVIIRYPLEA
jgi:hypothetical protein